MLLSLRISDRISVRSHQRSASMCQALLMIWWQIVRSASDSCLLAGLCDTGRDLISSLPRIMTIVLRACVESVWGRMTRVWDKSGSERRISCRRQGPRRRRSSILTWQYLTAALRETLMVRGKLSLALDSSVRIILGSTGWNPSPKTMMTCRFLGSCRAIHSKVLLCRRGTPLVVLELLTRFWLWLWLVILLAYQRNRGAVVGSGGDFTAHITTYPPLSL